MLDGVYLVALNSFVDLLHVDGLKDDAHQALLAVELCPFLV